MTTRVYLIRHGVTESNRQRRYMGRSEEGLSGEGRWQARQLALRGASLGLEALYCSPLQRARDTAEIVGQPHRLRPEVAPDFNELDLSRWEGMTASEIEAGDGEAWQTWCADPASLRLAGIESFATLQQRIRRGLEGLVRRHAESTIAIVTHDGVVRVAVLESLAMSLGLYRAIPIDNTGLTTLDFAPERTYLRGLNDTGHLGDGSQPATPGPADR
jgi:broad specificity phosphatase PhoE